MEVADQVDARGLLCPLPLLKAKKALNALQAGQTLQVLATDPGSQRDFRVFCEQSGHRMLTSSDHDGEYRFVLEKV